MSLPRYPEYRDSGVEWLGEVPAHWEVSTLRRVTVDKCDGPFGSGIKSEHYTDEGVLVVRLQNIRAGRFHYGEPVFLSQSYFESELRGHEVLPGDVLVAGLGDENNLLGRACVAPLGLGDALVKADCFRFRLEPYRVLSSFVAMQLSASAQSDAGMLASGTTRSRIPLSTMQTRRLALPPLEEQTAIASFLDREIAKIDALVAEQEKLLTLLAEKRQATERAAQLAKRRKIVSLESLKEQFAKSEVDMLNIVIKGDSSGSVEALEDSLMKIEVSDEVGIQVIHRGVGAITQNDVNLATVDKAVIIGFNVRPNRQVADLAEREGVEIKYYSIIYKAIEDIEASLKGMLKPEYEEVVTSHSEIREIFRSSKFGNIAGVMVQDGEVKRGTKCRILRNGIATVNDLEISSLRRFKDDVNSVKEGYEAGINLGTFNDIEIGDIIETFEMQEIERK